MKTISKPIYEGGPLFACEEIHISEVRKGDTVFHNGQALTVGRESIQRDDFFGHMLFGKTYMFGRVPVIRFLTYKTGCLIPACHAPYLSEIRKLEVEGEKTQCEIIDFINKKYGISK